MTLSNKSEAREVAADGATLNHNSGRGWREKGDARLGPFNIDYKEYNKSFSVSTTVWAKTTRDALRMRLKPALRLVLGDEHKTRLWVIGDDIFHEMLEAWEEKYND